VFKSLERVVEQPEASSREGALSDGEVVVSAGGGVAIIGVRETVPSAVWVMARGGGDVAGWGMVIVVGADEVTDRGTADVLIECIVN